jgi:hypothetical protein
MVKTTVLLVLLLRLQQVLVKSTAPQVGSVRRASQDMAGSYAPCHFLLPMVSTTASQRSRCGVVAEILVDFW